MPDNRQGRLDFDSVEHRLNPPKMDSGNDLNLLLELEPESARWRRRTLFLVSVFLHFALIGLILSASGWIRHHAEMLALEAESKPPEQTTYLFVPPSVLKRLQQPPHTNTLSDENRRAQGRAPIINPFGRQVPYTRGNSPLPEIAGGGKPAPPAPPPAAPPGGGAPAPSPPPPTHEDGLKLLDVPKPAGSNARLPLSTPGEAIQQSLEAAVQGRAAGRFPGPGEGPGQLNNFNSNFSTEGPLILSDTRGVDFGPYLARIIYTVRQNWYAVIPESARLGEKGRVALDFDIQKDGSVPEIETSAPSGSEPLDRAARAGIRASIPFPPLPAEFTGNHLRLRFIFLYNLGYGP